MIRVLPDEVVNRIAAGEVVERPLSVVKELVENSLDAGATRIIVEISRGGKELIKVVDNGSGIPPGELPTAFSRHGTSKITAATDLDTIATLGFRGEALPSIASISRLTLTSREQGAPEAHSIKIEGGKMGPVEPTGAPPGTTIVVADLFFNTPARAKFLKTDATESLRVTQTLMALALANPEVSFSLHVDGRETFSTTGTGSLQEVVARLFNARLAKNCLSLAWDEGWVKLSGLIGNPETARGSRQQQFWALGKRPIASQMLSSALDRAYDTLLPRGQHPFCAITIQLEPRLVDVNVHPAKREVRFRQEQELYRAIVHAIRGALEQITPKEIEVEEKLFKLPPEPSYRPRELNFPTITTREEQPLYKTRPQIIPHEPVPQAASREESVQLPKKEEEGWPQNLRVIGQAKKLYIIAASEDGLYLVDQHAAHERIRYEELQAQQQKHPSQLLLSPERIELGVAESKALARVEKELGQMGFDWEDFGGGSILLRAVPVGLVSNPGEVLLDFATLALSSEFRGATPWQQKAKVLATMACHSAVRAGEVLPTKAMEQIIEQLSQCQVPRSCPHGRPTMLKLAWLEVNRHFQR